MRKQEEGKTYIIPPNFVDKMSVVGGMIRLRNLVEAILVASIVVGPPILLIPMSFSAKLYVAVLAGIPLLVIGCIGINGDSLFQFLTYWSDFRRNKRVARYNPHIKKPDNIRETLMSEESELPRDKILKKIAKLTGRTFEIEDHNLDDLYADVSMTVRFDDDDTVLSYGYGTENEVKKKEKKKQQKLERQLAALNASSMNEVKFNRKREPDEEEPAEVEIDELAEITSYIESVKKSRRSGAAGQTYRESVGNLGADLNRSNAVSDRGSTDVGAPEDTGEPPVFDIFIPSEDNQD